jgi:hypothetical protein
MEKRLKYPQAQQKANHYGKIASVLRNRHSEIEGYVNSARKVNTSLIDPNDVYGEYYDIYMKKVDDWVDIHSQQIAIFDSFLMDLETCINNAEALRDLWESRIGLWEEC